MLQTMIERLEAEKKRGEASNLPEVVQEATQKLDTIRQQWEKYGYNPHVMKMEKDVKNIVKAYHMDFYELDLARLDQIGDCPFCWFVRNHGTDLLPLEGNEITMGKAKGWFHAIRIQYTDGIHVKDSQRLYICDPKAKTMKRVKEFKNIQFRVQIGAVFS
jgi:hypothetical protein